MSMIRALLGGDVVGETSTSWRLRVMASGAMEARNICRYSRSQRLQHLPYRQPMATPQSNLETSGSAPPVGYRGYSFLDRLSAVALRTRATSFEARAEDTAEALPLSSRQLLLLVVGSGDDRDADCVCGGDLGCRRPLHAALRRSRNIHVSQREYFLPLHLSSRRSSSVAAGKHCCSWGGALLASLA